jgi:hypothetical protein
MRFDLLPEEVQVHCDIAAEHEIPAAVSSQVDQETER